MHAHQLVLFSYYTIYTSNIMYKPFFFFFLCPAIVSEINSCSVSYVRTEHRETARERVNESHNIRLRKCLSKHLKLSCVWLYMNIRTYICWQCDTPSTAIYTKRVSLPIPNAIQMGIYVVVL